MVHVLVADLFSPEEVNLTWAASAKMPWGAWAMTVCSGVDGGGAVLCSPFVTGVETASKSPVVQSW